jgi:two-component system sensor histidine kinase CpxA
VRSLFLKIFVIFWIAQSLIFVISTALILRQRFPNPGILSDFLFSSLHNEARESVEAYESGGCGLLGVYAKAHNHNIALQDDAGQFLCFPSEPQPVTSETIFSDGTTGKQEGQRYIWSVRATGTWGTKYVFQLSRPHSPDRLGIPARMMRFAFPQLPVAIAVGGVSTFVLVLLFTRPLVSLRKAAGELARGNLSARVREATPKSRFSEGDEFGALARDFNHMAERLESLVGAQKLLLRDVSHELRSPLARLSVALELAREDGTPETEPHLNRMERETHKLNQLIGQLLELSSMEALERVDAFSPVSLNSLLEEIIPDAEYEASQRQCAVGFSADADCTIRGNREMLYRAIENVVRNAIRYTSVGSEVDIRLSSEFLEDGQFAVIEVLDHGPGIPEAEVTNIFRPFYRVDPARSPETGGFGVGLAITERAVKLHNGTMVAFNRKGGGAAIRMRFPM